MPQITGDSSQPIATSVSLNKSFREKLRDLYKPTDFVRVINIDTEPFTWQYFPPEGEDESFTDNGTVRVVEGRRAFTPRYDGQMPGNEQLWRLEPGESEVLIGGNADLFIEGLYKRLVAKKIVASRHVEATQARSFNFSDPIVQDEYIHKIFLGIERPNFGEYKSAEPKTTVPARRGRPPKES